MCRPTNVAPPTPNALSASTCEGKNALGERGTRIRLRIHPLLVAAALPCLRSSVYLNRGYTVWFHLCTAFYLLTDVEFLRRALVVMGSSITMGWYAAIGNDWLRHGRFCHLLYMNMPPLLRSRMVDASGRVADAPGSLPVKVLSHVLDLLLHPGLVWILWRAHRCQTSPRDVVTWATVAGTYALSRLWSVVHRTHNGHGIGIFYAGYEVYDLHDLDSWPVAYAAEGIFYGLLVVVLLRRWGGGALGGMFLKM